MKFVPRDPMIITSRVEGPRGVARELNSILDFNSTYSIIFSRDAVDLGYSEAAYRPADWEKIHPDRVPYVSDFRGVERVILVTLKKVSVGNLSARNVDAAVLELDLPRMVPFDMILGRTFLRNFKLTFDMKKGYASLSRHHVPQPSS